METVLLIVGMASIGYFLYKSDAAKSPSLFASDPMADFPTLFNSSASNMLGIDINAAINLAQQKLIEREGNSYIVYPDKFGQPTVGIGHLVLPQDNLKMGDTITVQQRDTFFYHDIQAAAEAAAQQATDLGKTNTEFVAALISVNFQLGENWRNKFSTTWALLKTGNVSQAITHLFSSKWYADTPERVHDFVSSIQNTFTTEV